MQCVDRLDQPEMTPDIVTSNGNDRCPTLQQISGVRVVFLSLNGCVTHCLYHTPQLLPTRTEINNARTEWGRTEEHVLDGEVGDNSSGTHLFQTWQTVHKGEPGICQTKTNLCSFQVSFTRKT